MHIKSVSIPPKICAMPNVIIGMARTAIKTAQRLEDNEWPAELIQLSKHWNGVTIAISRNNREYLLKDGEIVQA